LFFLFLNIIFSRHCNIRGKSFNRKCRKVLSINKGYDTLNKILKKLNDESESIQTSVDLSPNDMLFFKYALIISVDIEK
jgi:hypothetical protein